MIPLTDISWQSRTWQWHLGNAITDINELVRILDLPQDALTTDFPVLVPLPWLSRIEPGNPQDPLLLQVLPRPAELAPAEGFLDDPLQEAHSAPIPGLLHKYQGRVLVVVSGACGVNCRYCFRRHFPYQDFRPDTARWHEIAAYIRRDPSITEVILSGGDPLVLSDRRLAWIAELIGGIDHVRTLRLHTRMPIAIPQRVCDELLGWMHATHLRIVMVVHTNHAQEIDDAVADAMAQLAGSGALLLNQSVLLREVNDSVKSLTALSRRLFDVGVTPYYLHLLDAVNGAAHFDVPEQEARHLMEGVAASLPGYLVPRLVREIPGEPFKVPR
ncbi:MAG TPA: EF-P beta-lysylation protein EpmB [Pseudomonadales bacterium]|nr:EF-P beta-lysylation protein EpmB [Pseudomonadales bacterium]